MFDRKIELRIHSTGKFSVFYVNQETFLNYIFSCRRRSPDSNHYNHCVVEDGLLQTGRLKVQTRITQSSTPKSTEQGGCTKRHLCTRQAAHDEIDKTDNPISQFSFAIAPKTREVQWGVSFIRIQFYNFDSNTQLVLCLFRTYRKSET